MSTPLERYDQFFPGTVGIYFFNGTLDTEKLQVSLDEVVSENPIFSSVIRKKKGREEEGEEEEELYLSHMIPSNIKIVVKEVEEKVYELYKPNEEGILISEEGMEFYKHIESIEFTPTLEPVFDKPICKITHLLTKYSKKSMVCVSMNHCIADAHTLTLFMKRWSLGRDNFEEAKYEQFDTHRDHLKIRKKEEMKGIDDPKFLDRLKWCHRRNYAPNPKIDGMRFLFQKHFVRKVIHFPKTKLHELKRLVKNEGKIFSSHDCVSAQIWRIYSALTLMKDEYEDPSPEPVITPFSIVINFRNRVDGIKTNYIGNGVTILNLDLTRNEVLEEFGFGELVMKIRSLVNSMDTGTFQTMIDLANIRPKGASYQRKTEVLIDDWRQVDLQKPSNFGHSDDEIVRCERVVFAPPKIQFALMTLFCVRICGDEDGGGMLVYGVFEPEEYEVLKDLDLADPKCVETVTQRILEKKKNDVQ